MSDLQQTLKEIIINNGSFITKEKAQKCLKEYIVLFHENHVNETILRDIKKAFGNGVLTMEKLVDEISST